MASLLGHVAGRQVSQDGTIPQFLGYRPLGHRRCLEQVRLGLVREARLDALALYIVYVPIIPRDGTHGHEAVRVVGLFLVRVKVTVDTKRLDMTFVGLPKRILLSVGLGSRNVGSDAGEVELLEQILRQARRGLRKS